MKINEFLEKYSLAIGLGVVFWICLDSWVLGLAMFAVFSNMSSDDDFSESSKSHQESKEDSENTFNSVSDDEFTD